MPNIGAGQEGAINLGIEVQSQGAERSLDRVEDEVKETVLAMERLNYVSDEALIKSNLLTSSQEKQSRALAITGQTLRRYERALERLSAAEAVHQRVNNAATRSVLKNAQDEVVAIERLDQAFAGLRRQVSLSASRTDLRNELQGERDILSQVRSTTKAIDEDIAKHNRRLRESKRRAAEISEEVGRREDVLVDLIKTYERIDQLDQRVTGRKRVQAEIDAEQRRGLDLQNQRIRRQINASNRRIAQSKENIRLIGDAVKGEESLARQAERFEGSTRRSAGYLTRQFRALRDFTVRYATIVGGFAVAGGVTAGVGGAIRQGEDLLITQQRLRVLIGDSEDFATAWERIRDVAERTGTSLAGTADLFETVFLQLEDLPGAGAASADFVEGINLLFLASASSAEEANRAIVQLRQSLQRGFVGSQELRILTAQVRLFDDVLKAAGLTGDTRITSQQLVNLFSTGSPGRNLIDERAAASQGRISREAQQVVNTFQELSANALAQSGLIDTINEGLRYFNAQLSDFETQRWFSDYFESLDLATQRFFDLSPVLVQISQRFAEFALDLANVGLFFVSLTKYVADFANVLRTATITIISLQLANAIVRTYQAQLSVAGESARSRGAKGHYREVTTIVLRNLFEGVRGAALTGAGILAAAGSIYVILDQLSDYFLGAFPAFERDESLRRRLISPTGEVRYGQFSADIETRARELGKENYEVQRLLQVYRALDREQKGQAIAAEGNANRRKSILAQAEAEIAEYHKALRDLERQQADGFIDFRDAIGSTALFDAPAEDIINTLIERRVISREDDGFRIGRGALHGHVRSADFIVERFRRFAEEYEKLSSSADRVIRAREIYEDIIARLDSVPDETNLADVVQSLGAFRLVASDPAEFFAGIGQYWGKLATGVDGLAAQVGNTRIQERLRELTDLVRTEADVENAVRILADLQIKLNRSVEQATAQRELRQAELGGDETAKRLAELAVQFSKRNFNVEEALGEAVSVVAEYQQIVNDNAQALADFRANFAGEEKDFEEALSKAYEGSVLADPRAVAAAEKNLKNALDLKTLLERIVAVGGDINALDERERALIEQRFRLLLGRGRTNRQRLLEGVNIYEVFARRTAEARFSGQGNIIDLYGRLGLTDNAHRAQLESQLFLTQQIRSAEIALTQAKLTGNQSAIATNEELLRQYNDLTPEVQELIDKWIGFRIQGLEQEALQQRLADGLTRIDRVAEVAIGSLRDGFIGLIDNAQSFSDVLSGILIQLRNLALDIFVFEPLEGFLRDRLKKGFLRDVAKDVPAAGKIVAADFGGARLSDGSGGQGQTSLYQTNYMPPDIAAHYQRELAEFAVQQQQQFEQNPYAAGLG